VFNGQLFSQKNGQL